MKRIVVIGGGITGLTATHRLVELRKETSTDYEITLLEASSRFGGVIQTEHRDGFLLERGPDSFITEKPEALTLAKRIGLEPHLIKTNQERRRSFIVRKDRLLPVPEGFHLLAPSRLWPLMTSDIFSWAGKARLAMDLILPRRKTNGLDDESLANFVRRRLGREALDRMAQPMVGGIYTADPEKLSMRASIPQLLEMEQVHRSVIRALWRSSQSSSDFGTSGARYNLFLSFDRGMQTLADCLAATLPPDTVSLNSTAESLALEETSGIWIIKTKSGGFIRADAICIALPSYAAAQLLRSIDSKLADELEAIPYASTATVNFAYNRADIAHTLDGFGFVVPIIEKRSLIACSFSSVKFAARAPEGKVLLRAFVGGALQPEIFQLDDAEMIQRIQVDLRDLLGVSKPPLFTLVTKWARSMPQYEVGHLERLSRIEDRLARISSIKLAGNSYTGVGISDCIRSGADAADELISLLSLRVN